MDFSSRTKYLCFIWLLLFMSHAQACTNIVIKAKDDTVMVGRTLEFGPDLASVLYLKSRGARFSDRSATNHHSLSWQGKYGYVYANGFGMDLPLDGMNEKGLSIGYLYLPGYTTYPTLSTTSSNTLKAISVMNLPHWLLSQYARVSDIKRELKNLRIYNDMKSVPQHPNVSLSLHMIVTDETGASITIEWLNGKTQIVDNKVGVLTNSPPFHWQLDNLKNYLGLSPYSPKPIKIQGMTYTVNGQGSGWLGLPGDFSPPSRFVKMVSMLSAVNSPDNAESALVLAQHVLANVFIPAGFVRSKEQAGQEQLDTTQWSVFKDLTHRKLYFNSYDYPMLQMIDLSQIDFSQRLKGKSLPLSHPSQQAVDVTQAILKSQ